jgi:hypothetical protein
LGRILIVIFIYNFIRYLLCVTKKCSLHETLAYFSPRLLRIEVKSNFDS